MSGIILTSPRAANSSLREPSAGVSSIATENFSPGLTTSVTIAPTKGTGPYLVRLRMYPGAYTTVTLQKGSTVGTSLANCFLGLYSIDGATLLASTDITTPLQALGSTTMGTFTLTYTNTVEQDLWLGILIGNSSTTACTLSGYTVASSQQLNLAPAVAQRHNNTGLDALPSSLTLTATTGMIFPWFRYE